MKESCGQISEKAQLITAELQPSALKVTCFQPYFCISFSFPWSNDVKRSGFLQRTLLTRLVRNQSLCVTIGDFTVPTELESMLSRQFMQHVSEGRRQDWPRHLMGAGNLPREPLFIRAKWPLQARQGKARQEQKQTRKRDVGVGRCEYTSARAQRASG